VEEKLYQTFIVYGQIVLKKNLDLEKEEWKIPQNKIMLLHFIQRREENSKEISGKHLKVKSLHPIQVIKEKYKRTQRLPSTYSISEMKPF
jgi:hypothetical protein